jgi:hypothetical protein
MKPYTPYPDINELLHLLLTRVQKVLGEQFVGMYLQGSLAAGDFDPARSDIDWLIVTRDKLDDSLYAALETMHAEITSSGHAWALNMEGSYLPQSALRRYDPTDDEHPALGTGGHFHKMLHGNGWILQRHVVREYSIRLAGADIKSLLDPVAPDDLRAAAKGILYEWWQPMLADVSRLDDDEYQAYAVLTMCRILCTIATGDVVSKPTAAQWAQTTLPEKWQPLIQQAAAWRHGTKMDVLDAVVAFIRYTLAKVST